jgi:four helix bundle protein
MKVENFEQLEVWQKAHQMALDVYKLTSGLPEEEEFGLILRMRKAACDVPSNIANGFERRQLAAKLALYREARAAVEELRYYFILCRDLGYTIDFENFSQTGEQLARMVGGLVGSIARVESGNERRGGGGGGRGGDRRGPRRSGGGRGRNDREPTSESAPSGDDIAGGEAGEIDRDHE